ncbi:MAG: hypothetical protein LBS85_07845 [Clostridiales Family XIII bacterium]|nr:hypothetical protein [Clostridiales Family XIII bacterium]
MSISPELEKKMDRLLLLREDVERAVAYCEGENAKVVDPVSGYSIGYRQGGAATVWVVYSVTDRAQAVLYNVYSHRMKIEG